MSNWQEIKHNPRLKKIYDDRIKIIRLIREFFWQRDFIETETPAAVRYPGQEPNLNPVPLAFEGPDGKKEKFYLQTSPEFAMKKLLAAGYGKIFQITKCFRNNEEFGGLHNTEFTMIEWYRAPGTYRDIMDDAETMFKYVAEKLPAKKLARGDGEMDVFANWDRISMKSAWAKYAGVNLDDYLEIGKMKKLAREKNYSVSDADTYDDLFYKIFLNGIEPKLGLEKPVFVYDYPAQMASLSQLCADDGRYAERFELYAGGLELANAFGELLDANEQSRRLEEDRKLREKNGKEVFPVDPEFIRALESGISAPAGGIALGVDRMVLLFTGARDLNEVIFQSVRDQINI